MTSRTSARVLVLEQQDVVLRFTAEALAAVGCEVRHGPDTTAALAAAIDFRPDAVLVHVVDDEGWLLVRSLREDARTRDCPLVAVGGRPLAAHLREPMLGQVEAYLVEPYDPNFLVAVMLGALSRRGVAVPPSVAPTWAEAPAREGPPPCAHVVPDVLRPTLASGRADWGATDGDPGRTVVRDGVVWRIWECHLGAQRGAAPHLFFESNGAVRRVRTFPTEWFGLPDEALMLVAEGR